MKANAVHHGFIVVVGTVLGGEERGVSLASGSGPIVTSGKGEASCSARCFGVSLDLMCRSVYRASVLPKLFLDKGYTRWFAFAIAFPSKEAVAHTNFKIFVIPGRELNH